MTGDEKIQEVLKAMKIIHAYRLMPGAVITCGITLYLQVRKEENRPVTDEEILSEIKNLFLPVSRLMQPKLFLQPNEKTGE